MAKRPTLIDCIFCGEKQVPRGTEDVLPKWLRDKLAWHAEQLHPGTKPAYVGYEYENFDDWGLDRAEGSWERATQKPTGEVPAPAHLPEVCRECNHGWMGRLEQHVRLLIPGLIIGEPKLLAPYDQFILTMWMIKTCLTYDAATPPRMIAEEFGSRQFYDSPVPPPGAQVMIAHDPDHVVEGAFGKIRLPLAAEPRGAIHIRFMFDQLRLYAILPLINRDDLKNVSQDGIRIPRLPMGPPYFHELWPPGPRFMWPSDEALIPRGDAPKTTP